MKLYLTNTPLILENDSGEEYRVERGEVVELTPEQYELVAAHVSATAAEAEDFADAAQAGSDGPEGGAPSEAAPKTPPADPQPEAKQPKRGKDAKAE